MSYWAFQADPARYRLLHEAVEQDETTWSVNQYGDKIHVGDSVVMWLSGPQAGAYALGEVTTEPAEIKEDDALTSYWTDAKEANKKTLRVRIQYTRRMFLHPLLRTRALEDPVLSKMLIVRRPSGTNFPITDEQFKRIEEILKEQPETWAREETILALALYLDLKNGTVTKPSDAKKRLARLIGRVPGAVEMRIGNFQHLDPTAEAKGLGNVGVQERSIWEEFAGRDEDLKEMAQETETKLLSGGGLRSPSEGTLKLVGNVGEIRRAVKRFNADAPAADTRARAILRHTTYWVLDGSTGTFGPGKFVGFVDLDFTRYEAAVDGKLAGARFDGNVTSRAIEKVVGVPYGRDPHLVERLRAWGAKLIGEDAFEGARGEDKWKFLTLPQAERRYWKVAPGEKARLWNELRDAGMIAIGWGELGDVTKLKSKDDLATRMQKVFPDYKDGTVKTNAAQVWSFAREIRVGDIVVANQGTSRIVGIGEVIGPYEFRSDRKEYQHTLPVRWFDVSTREIPEKGAWVRTVIEIPKHRYEALFSKTANGGEGMAAQEGSNIYEYLRERGLHFPTELVTTYLLSLKTKPFVILSWISGTGKTKLAQAVAEWAGSEKIVTQREEPEVAREGRWVYKLQPYNFDARKIRVAKEYAERFNLPYEGSVSVQFRFEKKLYRGTVGVLRPKGQLMWEFRLGIDLREALAASLKVGDFVVIESVSERDERPGTEADEIVAIEAVRKHRIEIEEVVRRHEFISVRADWLDGKEVLGFFNVLTEEYISRPFLNLLLRAHRDREHPYFVILDEMNLARVEHYFADLLSATESRTRNGEGIRQEPVHLHDFGQCTPLDAPDAWQRPSKCAGCKASDDEVEACSLHFEGVQLVPPRLRIPTNVHVTGTVNVDETTHMFSPKVLDRANVIEFNLVDLAGYGSDEDKSDFSLKNGMLELGAGSVAVQEDFHAAPKETREALVALKDLLAEYNLHFGYRVANEIALYVHNAVEHVGKKAADAALDVQVLQKILPKLHGPKQKLSEPLRKLLLFTVFGAVPTSIKEEDLVGIEAAASKAAPIPTPGSDSVKAKMPRSAAKIARMLRTLRVQGFVSFIE